MSRAANAPHKAAESAARHLFLEFVDVMAVPSIADRYLPNCTTESLRRRPVKGDPFVADELREWSDK
jgi:hypothetical protein